MLNDDERFTEIFRAFYAQVTAYTRRRMPGEAAQDVVAATFLAAWRHLDAVPADPLPWLYRAAALEIASQSRKDRRRLRLQERVTSTAADAREADHADQVATAERWKDAFASLNAGDREVLRLAAWEQLQPRQAAVVLGCSPVAFKVRLHRARRRLEGLLEQERAVRPPYHKQPGNELAPRRQSECSLSIEAPLPRWSVASPRQRGLTHDRSHPFASRRTGSSQPRIGRRARRLLGNARGSSPLERDHRAPSHRGVTCLGRPELG
ncbi:MAG: RNA polymerase sigma factor [Acidimicrobiales bacterium]